MAALDLNALQEMLSNAEKAVANEREIRKSLTRIENLQSNITQEVQHIYQLLDGNVEPKQRKTHATRQPVEADVEAPFGRKKDGTPRAKPGRTKEVNTDAAAE
jgi:hypothetical protein